MNKIQMTLIARHMYKIYCLTCRKENGYCSLPASTDKIIVTDKKSFLYREIRNRKCQVYEKRRFE